MSRSEESGPAVVGEGRFHETRIPDVETSSAGYAARFAGTVGEWFLQVQAARVRDLIEDRTRDALVVLDVGGGHHQLTEPLLAAGHRVVVHGSRVVCHARTREQCGPCRNGVARVVSDLWKLPFPDRSFDLVVGVRLLSHVEAWRELLREMARVSRRLILVDFPVRGGLHRLAAPLFGIKRRIEGNTRPYFGYSVREMSGAFDELGFHSRSVTRQFAVPMALHRALKIKACSRWVEGVARGVGITSWVGSPILMIGERETSSPGNGVGKEQGGK